MTPLIVKGAQQAPYHVTEIPLSEAIVTLLVATPKLGVLAVIVTVPGATPVTGTLTLVEPAAKVTVEGRVATLVLLERRLTVSALAGAADRFSVRSCIAPAAMVRPPIGVKKLLPPLAITWTLALPGVNPGADAVMLADPELEAADLRLCGRRGVPACDENIGCYRHR